jgi:hypothetical protein
MRKRSGVTRPETTASPRPHADSITRSSPRHRIAREQHARDIRIDHPLHDDGDARLGIEPHALAILERTFRARRRVNRPAPRRAAPLRKSR